MNHVLAAVILSLTPHFHHFNADAIVRDVSIPPISGQPQVEDAGNLLFGQQRVKLSGVEPSARSQCCNEQTEQQSCGLVAQQRLAAFLNGKTISCTITDIDIRFHRPVGVCYLPDGKDLNSLIIRAGLAAAAPNSPKSYQVAQSEAVTQDRGLWQLGFVDPQNWRKDRMTGKKLVSCDMPMRVLK